MTAKQVDQLVRALSVLLAVYEPPLEPIELEKVDTQSYTAGFRAGARSAYADVICRLRDVKADDGTGNVVRIGGDVA